MTRTEAREFMMQVAFQMESNGSFDVNDKASYFKDKKTGGQKEYCNNMFSLLCNKKEIIDSNIEEHSRNWKLSRMPKAELAILRIAACEILFMTDIPKSVSINEAVEMAKIYGTEDSQKFVNAILGKIDPATMA